jgi:cytochrome c biogenesis protein CcdA
LTGARVLSIGISVATGTCFAVIAGLSISAMVVPIRRFHVASIVLAAVAICLGWLAFRAARADVTEEETEKAVVAPLVRGMVGAFVGLILSLPCSSCSGPMLGASWLTPWENPRPALLPLAC